MTLHFVHGDVIRNGHITNEMHLCVQQQCFVAFLFFFFLVLNILMPWCVCLCMLSVVVVCVYGVWSYRTWHMHMLCILTELEYNQLNRIMFI